MFSSCCLEQALQQARSEVGFSDSKERFNVWVAYMNLECTFGTEKTADAVFSRASSHNDAKQVGKLWEGWFCSICSCMTCFMLEPES